MDRMRASFQSQFEDAEKYSSQSQRDSRDKHSVNIHWKHQTNLSSNSRRSPDEREDNCPFTPPPPRERLNYTRYQLELLRVIYDHVRYPNSVQKQLIAKRVGITRDQVKIWFQNRRRKDVLAKQKPSLESSERQDDSATKTDVDSSVVPKLVLDSIVMEIGKFKDAGNTSKKKRTKRKLDVTQDVDAANSKKLKMNYDMVNPPNQVTPTAFNGGNVHGHYDSPETSSRLHSRETIWTYTSKPNDSENVHLHDYFPCQKSRRSPLEGCQYLGKDDGAFHHNPTENLDGGHSSRSSPDSLVSSLGSCSSLDSLPVLSDLLKNSPHSPFSEHSPVDANHHRDRNYRDNHATRYPYAVVAEPPFLLSSFHQTDFTSPYHHSYWHTESPFQPITISTLPNPYYDMYDVVPPETACQRLTYDLPQYVQL